MLLEFALLAALGPSASPRAQEATRDALAARLALTPREREERLALAVAETLAGDAEGALARLAGAQVVDDELGRRLQAERERLTAWLALRDAFLEELERSGKPLTLELEGKKVSAPIRRQGDELVLLRAKEQRLAVRALAAVDLQNALPKERLVGSEEWLRLYAYALAGHPKAQRLAAEGEASAALRRDAAEFYPRLAELAPAARTLEWLAAHCAPADAAVARTALTALEGLLTAQRTRACVQARMPALGELAQRLLEVLAAAQGAAELLHAPLQVPADGVLRLSYDFRDPAQARDWLADDDYLSALRLQLAPLAPQEEGTRFAPGPQGLRGSGAFCWRHVLDFVPPVRVRYQVRWEPTGGKPGQSFAFGAGLLADAGERHVRAMELGFLYVDERDGRYAAIRPQGDATVQLGQSYTLELAHDGKGAEVRVDGRPRARAPAERLLQGHVFLWGHSDLSIQVATLEIEGRLAPDALAGLRAAWIEAQLAALGLRP